MAALLCYWINSLLAALLITHSPKLLETNKLCGWNHKLYNVYFKYYSQTLTDKNRIFLLKRVRSRITSSLLWYKYLLKHKYTVYSEMHLSSNINFNISQTNMIFSMFDETFFFCLSDIIAFSTLFHSNNKLL